MYSVRKKTMRKFLSLPLVTLCFFWVFSLRSANELEIGPVEVVS